MEIKEKRFRFLEHTADMYIESYGKNLAEAFQNSAIGLGFMVVESDNVAGKVTKKIVVESEDKESLLFDFLTKFLVFLDSEELVFHNVRVNKIEKTKKGLILNATAKGEKFNPKKHKEGTHIKAITYHGFELEEKKDNVRVKVLVDI